MRKLLNTLFVTSEDAYLALENENVVIYKEEGKAAQYPLQVLENIVSFSYKGASPALMGACVERDIGLSFLTPNGRLLARAAGASRGNVLLRKAQYRVSDSLPESCRVARSLIFGKVYNSRWVLERTLRDHALRVNVDKLREASMHLQAQLPLLLAAEELDGLRGMEGEASACYEPENRFSFSGVEPASAAGSSECSVVHDVYAVDARLHCRTGKRWTRRLCRVHASGSPGAHLTGTGSDGRTACAAGGSTGTDAHQYARFAKTTLSHPVRRRGAANGRCP